MPHCTVPQTFFSFSVFPDLHNDHVDVHFNILMVLHIKKTTIVIIVSYTRAEDAVVLEIINERIGHVHSVWLNRPNNKEAKNLFSTVLPLLLLSLSLTSSLLSSSLLLLSLLSLLSSSLPLLLLSLLSFSLSLLCEQLSFLSQRERKRERVRER